jgi:hypothetical protein
LRERNNVSALTRSESASIAAYHDFHVLYAFAHRNRVALAIVDWVLDLSFGLVTAGKGSREAGRCQQL